MNTKIQTTESVLATIVLYNTSLEHSETFQSLSKALKSTENRVEILVYDNSPSMMYAGEIYDSWNIHYIHDEMNSGISRAYNAACNLAKKLGKKWLFLLDQDSTFPENTFHTYGEAMERGHTSLLAPQLFSQKKLISPFGPQPGKGKILKNIDPGIYSLHKVMPVNSGIMVRVEHFEACGGYNECFPLDYSDFAFIDRYKQTHTCFEVLPLVCEHQFSGLNAGSKASAHDRFNAFCRTTHLYRKNVDPATDAIKIILSRALRLTLHFRSPDFLKIALRNLLESR
ncbi:glycosyl transferase, group 2 family protein [Fulvivirga imtechensis AK7]|uniref:Glycosyl transferase, group 2 family protein n=1 Tax=Fulvivirga imtechensis AK7 TaxID=1237149 RepID=L8JSQ5_9BACT|nr:glycosyltransferase [Fulvivirga imtechensis]ELR71223.1 glycosyl transferase, group 2 family protein [Fulvivirga imtechensis AK7]